MTEFSSRVLTNPAPTAIDGAPQPYAPVIPYLPPLLQDGGPYYHHLVTVEPTEGATAARLVLGRYAWTASGSGDVWKLVEIDPLELHARTSTPYIVAGPLALNPECPQLWTVIEAQAASVSVAAVPRKPGMATIQLMPGVAPPMQAPYVLSLPPSMALPRTDQPTPCRIEVYPLTSSASFAFRLRLYSKGELKGETPFLFHAAVRSPKAWEISHGHRISEVDSATGASSEIVDATYESGDMSPVLTVFSGRLLAVFMWKPTASASTTNAAALVPEDVLPDLPIFKQLSLHGRSPGWDRV
jgi:hypothetical protein